MLNRLEAPSRLVIRTCLALFTAAVILLGQSAFWTGAAVSGWMRAIIIGTLVLAYFRPHLGLLFLAVCVPLGQVGSRTLDSNMRGAEALVLAFLAGALIRGWVLHRFRSVPSNIVQIASFAFGMVVAASCAEQLWFAQLQRDFPTRFLSDTAIYATRRYLIAFDGLDMIFSAMLLLEGLALMLYATHYSRVRAWFASRLIVMVVAGVVSAAGVNVVYAVSHLTQAGVSIPAVRDMITQRWSFHVGDVNAAGSFFAMGMLIAFGRARSNHRTIWLAAGFTAGVALWFTASRTAVLAAGIVAVITVAHAAFGRSLSVAKTAGIASIAMVALAIVVGSFPAGFFGPGAEYALRIRRLFLDVSARMISAEPLFGIGIGQFALWSPHFAAQELLDIYDRDNAHNYFAQVAAELGLLGFAGFLGVLAAALWVGTSRSERRSPLAIAPVLTGLAVFILTWLGGHPLLVPEVAFPFWIAMGILPGVLAVSRLRRDAIVFAAALGAFLVVSIPPRVQSKSARIDFTRVTYGISNGIPTDRARFFVATGRSRLRIPLRARAAASDAPITVDIFINDQLAESVPLGDPGWHDATVELSERRLDNAPHKIDVRARQREDDSRVEVGKWEIIATPHA